MINISAQRNARPCILWYNTHAQNRQKKQLEQYAKDQHSFCPKQQIFNQALHMMGIAKTTNFNIEETLAEPVSELAFYAYEVGNASPITPNFDSKTGKITKYKIE